MEHLENDMDDLFQKAGELYPLKTTGSDWDAVAGKLENEIPGDVHDLSGPTAMRSRRRRWLLLLLLIPMGFGIFYFSGNLKTGQNGLSAKPQNVSADQNKKTSVVADNRSIPVVPPDKNKSAASGNMNSTSGRSKTPEYGSTNGGLPSENKRQANVSGGSQLNASGGHRLNVSGGKQLNASGGNQLTAKNAQNSNKQTSFSAAKSNSDLNVNTPGMASKETEAGVVDKSIDKASSSATGSVPKAEVAAVPGVVATPKETDAAINNTDKTESSKKASQDSSLATKKTNTSSKQSKGFYVGLVIGPDISSVDFQAVKHPGYSLGATVGYRFNKKLAVETGFLYDKKYYYSDGTHYKNQPPNYTLVNIDGNCDMFEIPLTVRYDFSFKKNGNFFAKGGFSSYLMRKQTYSGISHDNYNGPDTAWGPKSNYPQENYFLSIIQFSGGYEFSISGKTKIQIEPYIKIPLQGIGSGSMPISSAGIYFGITHSFR